MNTTKVMNDVANYLKENSQYDVKLLEINIDIFLIGEEYKIHVTAIFSDDMQLTYEVSDKKYFERDAVQRRADAIIRTASKRFEYIHAGWEFREEVENRSINKPSDVNVKLAKELIESGRLSYVEPRFTLVDNAEKKIIAYITVGCQEEHEGYMYRDNWDMDSRVDCIHMVSFSTDNENYNIPVVGYRKLTEEELDALDCIEDEEEEVSSFDHIEDDEVETSAEKNLCDEIIEAINCDVEEQCKLPNGDIRISFTNGLLFIVDSAGYKVDIYDNTLVGTYYREEKILKDRNYNNVDFELGWMNKAVEKLSKKEALKRLNDLIQWSCIQSDGLVRAKIKEDDLQRFEELLNMLETDWISVDYASDLNDNPIAYVEYEEPYEETANESWFME